MLCCYWQQRAAAGGNVDQPAVMVKHDLDCDTLTTFTRRSVCDICEDSYQEFHQMCVPMWTHVIQKLESVALDVLPII